MPTDTMMPTAPEPGDSVRPFVLATGPTSVIHRIADGGHAEAGDGHQAERVGSTATM